MTLPFSGLRVIDLTHARAGPCCVRQLADWGADVIKVENPMDSGDPALNERHGFDFQNLHRNKRSISLNLKTEEGRQVLYDLVRDADVIAENFRPEVKIRLKVDYDTLSRMNPRLIYASNSGYGQDGPYVKRTGVDQIIQGMSGLMSVTGHPGGKPTRVGIAIADMAAGVLLANGVLTALYERERTGRGRWVQTSLLEAMLFMMDFQAARWLVAGEVPQMAGNNHPYIGGVGVFPTRDGHITIAAESDVKFTDLCKVLEVPELSADPKYATRDARSENKFILNDEVEKHTVRFSSAELIEALNAVSVNCGPIYTVDQVFADPQVRHLGIAQPVHHPVLGDLELVAQGYRFSDLRTENRSAAPEKGEHTRSILEEIGYPAERIEELIGSGAAVA